MMSPSPLPPIGSAAVAVRQFRSADGARLAVSPHGGTICQWWSADGRERLYLSPANPWHPQDPIRGGVPVIFPQFAGRGPLPKHGFARSAAWTIAEEGTDADGGGRVVMTMGDTAETRALWPHSFRLELTAGFQGNRLSVALAVRNTGEDAFTFTAALHSYCRADAATDRITGLEGLAVIDSAAGGRQGRSADEPIRLDASMDRIFLGVPGPITLERPDGRLRVEQQGFADAVVWKPAPDERLPALPPDGHRHFICIEAAAIGQPVTLAPAARWTGTQRFQVLDRPPEAAPGATP